MGRHSKQAGGMGSENLTYAERAALGFGTAKERLGKDSIKDFDACALCLQPVQNPVVTPDGVLYEKEAILECLLAQKKDYSRKLALYEAQLADEARAADASAKAAEEARLEQFHLMNHGGGGGAPAAGSAGAAGGAGGSPGGASSVAATAAQAEAQRGLKAFWMPGKTPDAAARAAKPSADTLCPATGKKLRLKELSPVHFTPLPGDEGAARDGARFMCPTCKEAFTNVSRIVVLRNAGDALCEECFKRFVEPEGSYNGVKVRAKDAVRLERGGTGFAATSKVEASTYAPMGLGSGLADRRGQLAGGRSKFAGMRLG